MKQAILVIYFVGVSFFPSMCLAASEHSGMTMPSTKPESQIIEISPQRLQTIGVTYAPAKQQDLTKTIKTVGYVEVDERNVAHIHVKFEGWIEKIFVNFTGEEVKQNQPLFSVYSPDLVTAQQEYLLALQAKKQLGDQSTLDAAYQRLLYWDVPAQTIQQLTKTGKVTKDITIYSPITGTVINKTALQGMKISQDNELYTIADLSKLWILADIYEYELPYIKTGEQAMISLTYLPNQTFSAKIRFINPIVDPQTRTVKVRFEVTNPHGQLKPGMYSNVELKIPLGKHLVVPQNAILLTGERAVIFIYLGNGKIEWRNVKLGIRSGDWVEILAGVKEGEQVITSANFLLDAESQLKGAMGGMQH
jgi:Cu(I)/Ag(I) efflux system membrane fusion protein